MYKAVKTGYIIPTIQKSRVTCVSRRWRKWKTLIAPGTCGYCLRMNGRILAIADNAWYNIPVHLNCGCSSENVTAIVAGTATNGGMNGVDRYLLLFGCLPSGYLTKEAARKAGWKPALGNLDEILPGMMIGGDIYKNRDHRLPESVGRTWYEADFDYDGGYRNHCRLVYSNDGLVFITYDHYLTFLEITMEVSA